MDETRLKAFELSMEIARLPKQYINNGVGNFTTPGSESIDVILTRATMIEKYLLG